MPADAGRWPNFSPAEPACRGTGRLLVNKAALGRRYATGDPAFAPHLDMLRNAFSVPSHFTKCSDCNRQPDRCPQGHRADGTCLIGAALEDVQTEGCEYDECREEDCH